MKRLSLVIIFSFAAVQVYAQQDLFVWENISVEQIVSEEVQDTFKLYIKLPDEYFDSSKSYPLLVLLDGDILFPIASGVLRYLQLGNHIPEMIIVGIGYGTLDWRKGNQRSRDYTAHSTEGRTFEGGAEKYLTFMKNELLPMIESKYRVDQSNKAFFGHSLGGQMVLNTYLHHPNLFTKFISSSPAIFRWMNYYRNLIADQTNAIQMSDSRIFISVGEKELKQQYHIPINEVVKKLGVIASKSKVIYKKFQDADHFTAPAMALNFGLVELVKD